jgi:hypothetical protein
MTVEEKSPEKGSWAVTLARATPGRARTSRRSSSRKSRRAVPSGYRDAGREMLPVSTPWGSNPGSSRRTSWKLRSMSPAPARRTKARATCPVTSPLRIRTARRLAVPLRLSERKTAFSSERMTWRRGMAPKKRPAPMPRAMVKATTVPSRSDLRPPGELVHPEAPQDLKSPIPQKESETAPQHSQQDRVGEELSPQDQAIRPQGQPGGQLLHAGVGAGQHEIGDVHAPDEEDEGHPAPEEEEGGPDLRQEVIPGGHDAGVEPGVLQELAGPGHGPLINEALVQGVQLGPGLLQGGAGGQPSDLTVVVAVEPLQGPLLRAKRDGKEEIPGLVLPREGETLREDANDLEGHPVQPQVGPHHGRVAVELLRPVPMGEDHPLMVPGLHLLPEEVPPQGG